jgi:predicted aconitase
MTDFSIDRNQDEIWFGVLQQKFGHISENLIQDIKMALDAKKKFGAIAKSQKQALFIQLSLEKLRADYMVCVEARKNKDANVKEVSASMLTTTAFMMVQVADMFLGTNQFANQELPFDYVGIADMFIDNLCEDYDRLVVELNNHTMTEFGAPLDEIKQTINMVKEILKQKPQ